MRYKGDLTWWLESAIVFLLREVVQSWASFSATLFAEDPGERMLSFNEQENDS